MSASIGRTAGLVVCTFIAATAVAANVFEPNLQPAAEPSAAEVVSKSASASEGAGSLPGVTVEDLAPAQLAAHQPDSPAHQPPRSSRNVADQRLLDPFDARTDLTRDGRGPAWPVVYAAVPTASAEPALAAVEHEALLPALLPLAMIVVGLVALLAMLLRRREKADPYFGD